MRALRLLPLALFVLPAGIASGDGTAPPAAVMVATEAIPNEAAMKPVEPGKAPQGSQAASPLELTDKKPECLKEPLKAEGRVLYATVGGAKKVALAFARGAKDEMTLLLDANGDGRLDGTTEATPMKASPWVGPGQKTLGTLWKLEHAKVGGGEVNLDLKETLAGWAGQLVTGDRATPPVPLEFTDAAPAAVAKPPKLDGTVKWATATLGGVRVIVAAARAANGALTVVAVPETKDADLSAAKPVATKAAAVMDALVRIGTGYATEPVSFGEVAKKEGDAGDAPAGTLKATVQVTVRDNSTTGRINAGATRRGTTAVDGVPYVLCLVDGDFDGKYDSIDDLWWFSTAEEGSKVRGGRVNYANMFEATEPHFALTGKGTAWRLVSVGPDGTAKVAPEPNPGDLEAYLARRNHHVEEKRWFPGFEAGLAAFVEAKKLDLSRPKATAPPAWHFLLDFDAARALAAKEGKPLLVDFEADWCVWCKRLDFHVYPDAEVGAELSKFTLVKINGELDPKKTFANMKDPKGKNWSGIPAIAVFGPDGKPILFKMKSGATVEAAEVDHIAGFLEPTLFSAALRSAHAAWVAATKSPAASDPAPAPAPAEPSKPADPK